MAAVFI